MELHKSGQLSFEHVVTVNMDEYVGLSPTHEQSYHAFMWTNLFEHIDIRPENVHILDGMAEDLQAECDKVSGAACRALADCLLAPPRRKLRAPSSTQPWQLARGSAMSL